MPKLSAITIEILKRDAKRLCRNTPITHSAALDQVAAAHGYANWSLLMKQANRVPDTRLQCAPASTPLEFQRTPEEMQQALRIIPYRRGIQQDEIALQQIDDVCLKLVSPHNAVTYAIQYMVSLLQVPRLSFRSGARAYHEMRRWLPYFIQPISHGSSILVNRHYKPVGMTRSDWVDYGEYSHLHLRLNTKQLAMLPPPRSGPGYLFHDGCPPWLGRKESKAYLARLHILQDLIHGSSFSAER